MSDALARVIFNVRSAFELHAIIDFAVFHRRQFYCRTNGLLPGWVFELEVLPSENRESIEKEIFPNRPESQQVGERPA